MKPSSDVLQELGLERDALVEEVARLEPPTVPAALGLSGVQSASAARLDTQAVARRVVEDAHFGSGRKAVLPASVPLISGIEVEHLDRDRSIVIVTHRDGQVSAVGDHAQLDQGELLLDARSGPVWALLVRAEGELLVGVAPGGAVVLYRHVRTPSPELRAFLEAPVAAAPEAPDVPIAALLGGFPVEQWLEEAVRHYAGSPGLMSRLTAAGLLGRLWAPPAGSDRKELVARVLETGGPLRTARSWFSSLPPETRSAGVRLASGGCEALYARLVALEHAISESVEDQGTRAAAWLHDRDDLECIAALVSRESGEAVLITALEQLDQRCAAHHSLWAFIELPASERLRAVAWQEPDAWWGKPFSTEV